MMINVQENSQPTRIGTDGASLSRRFGIPLLLFLVDAGKPLSGDFAYPFLTSREWDKESGQYYYRARYYNSYVGRFNRRDPIGYGAGMNLYTYVGNNPVIFTDPLGKQAGGKEEGICDVFCGFAGKIGEIQISKVPVEAPPDRPVVGADAYFGMRFSMDFKILKSTEAAEKACCCKEYGWIQMITTNTHKPPAEESVIDRESGRKDDSPFYYSGEQAKSKGIWVKDTRSPKFGDAPYITSNKADELDPKKNIKEFYSNFETCLVCRRDKPKTDSILKCVKWGYAVARGTPGFQGTGWSLKETYFECGGDCPSKEFINTLENNFKKYQFEIESLKLLKITPLGGIYRR